MPTTEIIPFFDRMPRSYFTRSQSVTITTTSYSRGSSNDTFPPRPLSYFSTELEPRRSQTISTSRETVQPAGSCRSSEPCHCNQCKGEGYDFDCTTNIHVVGDQTNVAAVIRYVHDLLGIISTEQTAIPVPTGQTEYDYSIIQNYKAWFIDRDDTPFCTEKKSTFFKRPIIYRDKDDDELFPPIHFNNLSTVVRDSIYNKSLAVLVICADNAADFSAILAVEAAKKPYTTLVYEQRGTHYDVPDVYKQIFKQGIVAIPISPLAPIPDAALLAKKVDNAVISLIKNKFMLTKERFMEIKYPINETVAAYGQIRIV